MKPALQYRSTEFSTLCRRHHVRRLSVFGSAARDEMRTDSDVDLLIEFEAGQSPSLAGFARLKQELEATLGVASIDLATPAILRNPYRRQAIVRDLQQLYAAWRRPCCTTGKMSRFAASPFFPRRGRSTITLYISSRISISG